MLLYEKYNDTVWYIKSIDDSPIILFHRSQAKQTDHNRNRENYLTSYSVGEIGTSKSNFSSSMRSKAPSTLLENPACAKRENH